MWIKTEEYTDNELFNNLKNKVSRGVVLYNMRRNQETAYGFFVDYIIDEYNVTLIQCNRIAKKMIEYLGFDKQYYITHNVGKTKYVVNYYDGVKTHKDDSPFYDVYCTNNKNEMNKFVQKLQKDGYVEKHN